MKISTKTKLALLFLGLACFIGVITSLLVNSLITNQIIKEAQERVKHDLDTARFVYSMKMREIDRAIRWASIRHVLKKALKERNVTPIREELTALMVEEGLDFLLLTDREGRVLFRVHNPKVEGDSLIHQPSIRAALERKGISGTEVMTREELLREGEALANRAALRLIPTPKAKPTDQQEETSGLILRSTHPVLDFSGEVLGALSGGVLLNRNNEIVDLIKNIVFKDAKYKGKDVGTATIFLRDVRIATNVLDREGKRAIGTLAMKEVQEQVLEKGMPWIQRAFVVDDWYITAYEPIRDIEGRIVGILYVGLLESRYTLMKERLILLFFLLSMSAMLVALTISFLLSWKVPKSPSPLGEG
ncbi:MAG: cache domain-containing protein [Desulfobacterota bacterium]|nr:cache domain-containing protein [Thermodesulfobacteriota bacterium]